MRIRDQLVILRMTLSDTRTALLLLLTLGHVLRSGCQTTLTFDVTSNKYNPITSGCLHLSKNIADICRRQKFSI